MSITRRGALAGFLSTAVCATPAMAAGGEVFVLSTLYSRHAATPSYNVTTLRRVIEAIDADVLVLDVTPRELGERRVHESKVEYVGAVFPYLVASRKTAYAAEPGEPLFAQLVEPLGRAFAQLPATVSEALNQYEDALFRILREHWTNAAAVNDAHTDQLMSAKVALTGQAVPAYQRGQKQWDEHTAARTLEAVARHPGARVLLLGGVENSARVRALLTQAGTPLVAMPSWLSQHSL